jgi:hypothetical protein
MKFAVHDKGTPSSRSDIISPERVRGRGGDQIQRRFLERREGRQLA